MTVLLLTQKERRQCQLRYGELASGRVLSSVCYWRGATRIELWQSSWSSLDLLFLAAKHKKLTICRNSKSF